MSYDIRLTATAKEDLRGIAFAVAEASGEKAIARRFVLEIRETCGALRDFPLRGALPKDRVLRGMGYRYLNHQGYLIFYRVNDGESLVDIMAIFHEKMDYLRVLRRFGER